MKSMGIVTTAIAGGCPRRENNTNNGREGRPNEEDRDMNRKLTKRAGAVAIMIAGALAMLAGVLPAHGDLRTWNSDGAGTWDDSTTGNWSPAQVPVNGNRVTINRANGATVDFASANFSGANRLLAPSDWQPALILGGSEGTNILQVGSGDTLQFDAPHKSWVGILVNNGGRLNISGGMVTSLTTVDWSDALKVNNGGDVTVSGTGLLQFKATEEIFVADTAGHSASLTVSGSGQFTCPNTTFSSGGDFNARAGNSTVSVSDSGLLRVARDLLVGTSGGTHVWTLSGGTLERAGAKNYEWQLGNNNGNGSVTVTQTGGQFLNLNHTTYLRKTVQYAISGDPTSVSMVNGTLYVDGTLNQSGGYVNNQYELHVGNTAGATGVYTATAGNLRTRGLHIGAVANASGILTLNAGVVYTNSVDGLTSQQRIVIGATSGTGTGTLEIKGLSGIFGSGFRHVDLNPTGVLKGYGTLSSMVGNFQMNGKVIADGYGSDQTLNLSGRSGLTNTVENGTDKGFYAVNGGKLVLANVAVAAGNTTVNWGESTGDADIDLVNSARIAFTGAASGNLSGSLLATDRTDVPAGLHRPIGAWRLTSPDFTSAVLTFRYDDGALAAQGIPEDSIRLRRYDGSVWVDVAVTQDAANNRLTTASQISPISAGEGYLGLFTIHAPPQGTVLSIR